MSFLRNTLRRADVLLILLSLLTSWLLYVYYAQPVEAVQLPEAPSSAAVVAPPPPEQKEPQGRRRTPRQVAPVRFLMYNVHDYFVEKDPKRAPHARRLKPREQREAVAQQIASVRPEVVGLVEIGGPAALDDLAERLAARGLQYPYKKVLTRWGEERALGLLSMHPIVADHSVADCKLVGNSARRMLRGILDVSVQPEGDTRVFRIVGAHLKSRVSDNPSAATALRAREARTLADHIAHALRQDPQASILVYGDWNDGPQEPALAVLTRGAAGLKRLTPKDAHGETWTIYYKDGCEYNAFDQIYVSPALAKSMGRKSEQGIVSQPSGVQPSDHRAVWCDMR